MASPSFPKEGLGWLRAQASWRDIGAKTGIEPVGTYPSNPPLSNDRDSWKSNKTIGIDVNADPHRARPFQLFQPFAHDLLQFDGTQGMDQQPVTMAAAQHGERRGRGAVDGKTIHPWCCLADEAGGFHRFAVVLGRDDDRRPARERRGLRLATGLDFGGVKPSRSFLIRAWMTAAFGIRVWT